MTKRHLRSMLHLQMGQEVLYLLMTLGIISSIVLLVYVGFLHSEHAKMTTRLEATAAEAEALRAELARLNAAAALRPEPTPPPETDDQPPIITLSEAQGYFFPSGSALLSDDFRTQIAQEIVPQIVRIGDRYDADVIEVIGHTDEVPLRSSASTIDKNLLAFLNHAIAGEPSAADNVGLGMIRAAAVARELQQDNRLAAYVILALSAGQTTTTLHRLSPGLSPPQDDQHRRRIEIRVRRQF